MPLDIPVLRDGTAWARKWWQAAALSASKIPKYSGAWPQGMKQARLVGAGSDETLAGLGVSSTGPLTAWVVLRLRPVMVEDTDLPTVVVGEQAAGGSGGTP